MIYKVCSVFTWISAQRCFPRENSTAEMFWYIETRRFDLNLELEDQQKFWNEGIGKGYQIETHPGTKAQSNSPKKIL